MKASKIVLTLVVLLLLSQHVPAQIEVTSHKGQGLPIVSEGSAATLYVSPKESETVRKVAQLNHEEYSAGRKAAIGRLRFAIDRNKPSHTISIICGDPGMMVEKVIVERGGLKKSYIGPKPSCNN